MLIIMGNRIWNLVQHCLSLSCYQCYMISMKHFLICFLIVLFPCPVQVAAFNLDSLYQCLDREIKKSEHYIMDKQEAITAMRNQYDAASDNMSKYELAWELYDANKSFMNDSALHYLNICVGLAQKMNQYNKIQDSYIALAHQYAAAGFYNEALKYLHLVNRQSLKGQQLIDYYYCCNHLYGEMGYYSKDEELKQRSYHLSNVYRDSLCNVLLPTDNLFLWRKIVQLCTERDYRQALKLSDVWLKQVKENSPEYANMAFFRSEIYSGMGDTEQRKYWLTLSALSDIRNAVMDQASLWSLAKILSIEGDLERSNRYIEYSWNCTQRYNTHLRSWLVSPVLGVISDTYKANLSRSNSMLRWLIVAVSLLSVFLLASFIYVSRQKKQLSVARNDLSRINAQLSELNNRLTGNNEQLELLNKKLSETNKVKDEYIGKFLSACSEYIDKLDAYRMKVNRKLKANQIKDLMIMTSSEDLKEDEIRELFDNFDTVFLNLFPNFVSDFNALLQPDYRIITTSKHQLTTDLRIFALIRLGIEESSHIAEFLRYSPNSIYNYRARIKNKAICPREEFEQHVREIGM